MNNIEILENFIDKVDIYFDDDIGDCAITSKIAGIIENLIQENKELKEETTENQDYIKDLQKKLTNAIEIKYIHQDYILKSKVKEIVELYDNTLQCTRKYNQDLADILCDLEELLEEGE